MDTGKVTRFEVIDHTGNPQGRILVRFGVSVELSLQDGGRTLKVFLTDLPPEERKRVEAEISAGLAEDFARTPEIIRAIRARLNTAGKFSGD